jgi:hypothetical protein
MSYTYLLEQGEESSAESFADIPASVQSRSRNTLAKSYCNDSGMESCHASRYGTTYAPSTAGHGAEEWTSSQGDSLAKTLHCAAKPLESMGIEADSGKRWRGSLAKWDRDSCSWKTHQLSLFGGLETFSETWPKWGIMRNGECWAQDIAVDQWNASEFGLPAPTKAMGKRGWGIAAKPRYSAELEANARLFGYKPHPSVLEWSMGWIPTWTRLVPLEMDKFRKWLDSHGKFSPANGKAATASKKLP